MHITLLAVGKPKIRASIAWFDAYRTRLPWKLTLHELPESKKDTAAARKRDEAQRLLARCDANTRAVLIALDETGESKTSREFAAMLGRYAQQGDSHFGFIIGGPDGLDDTVRTAAHHRLAFGRMTWPHQLARLMLMEQLYRASTILGNHPYHRD